MPRTVWRVRTLAREEGIPPVDAAVILMEAALPNVVDPNSYIARRDVKRARDALRAYRQPTAPTRRRAEEPFAWPRLRQEPVSYLTTAEVLAVHTALTDEFAGTADAIWPPGTKDAGLLDSAVNRPRMAQAKYPNVPAAAGALVHALIQNHAFHNGNKRTALISLVIFLRLVNRYYILFDQDEVYHFIVSLADHSIAPLRDGRHDSELETYAAFAWIQDRAAAPESGDATLRWHDLDPLLKHFGCALKVKPGNRCDIHRGDIRIQAHYRSPGDELTAKEVSDIRRKLRLDPSHGVDSAIFYSRGEPHPDIGDIIHYYRGVLQRLALLDRA